MRISFLVLALSFSTQFCLAEPRRDRVCFSAAETREKIVIDKLFEPFSALRAAAHRWQAEAIGVQLCQRNREMVYEIRLLPRSGRVIHLILNAENGEVLDIENPDLEQPPLAPMGPAFGPIVPRIDGYGPRMGRGR